MPTYRRPRLLARAVDSLLSQTYADWVCEVHNDAPDDEAPARLLAKVGDPRFILVNHTCNIGGTETFNLAFNGVEEPFYSMLEDDNWWEPAFLDTMLGVAGDYLDADIFWANMRVWQEGADGSFYDTGRVVNAYQPSDSPKAIDWGQQGQLMGAIHSQSSLLIRTLPGLNFRTPSVPIAVVEMFRERMFPHPLIFVPQPLANFSLTLQTSRSSDRAEWAELQVMLAATFLRNAGFDNGRALSAWRSAHAQQPPQVSSLLLAGLIEPSCRRFWRLANFRDWLVLLRGAIRRPNVLLRVWRSRYTHSDWWAFLEEHTAKRFTEVHSKTVAG